MLFELPRSWALDLPRVNLPNFTAIITKVEANIGNHLLFMYLPFSDGIRTV